MRQETEINTKPFKIGDYHSQNSWLNKFLEKFNSPLKPPIQSKVFVPFDMDKNHHYYQLADLVGYYKEEVHNDSGRLNYSDVEDGRQVIVKIKREAGTSSWYIKGIYMRNEDTHDITSLSKLELKVYDQRVH